MTRASLVVSGCLALCLAGCSGAAPPHPPAARPSPTSGRPTSAGPTSGRPAAAPVDPQQDQPLIAHATWTVNAKGRQLQVVPTRAGRTDLFDGAAARAWTEILAKAPDAGTPGMHDQFLCHWDFARAVEPDKPSWNLEPWRPAVGYAKTVSALCNPGGPEG